MTRRVTRCVSWQWWVTPRPLRSKAIHRWYVFPHSFTSELVHALINKWGLSTTDMILDPFCGAGTTILAAKERGIPATGYDLSPFAVFASCVKLGEYMPEDMNDLWQALCSRIVSEKWSEAQANYPELVHRALPGRLLGAFESLLCEIDRLDCTSIQKNFFKLAVFSILPYYSRATISGGWLKWVSKRTNVRSINSKLKQCVEGMLADIQFQISNACDATRSWPVGIADARRLPDKAGSYSAVITSPPYPNRHDYTRVFGVELMLAFLTWGETQQLRYQSFHSHPEARPARPVHDGYHQPWRLSQIISKIENAKVDSRVLKMLKGYFLDIYLTLKELSRVCKEGARIAIVVGNAQYSGIAVPVDLIVADISETLQLTCDRIITARYRGNSAQQMGKYGRIPSRESVVVLRNTKSMER